MYTYMYIYSLVFLWVLPILQKEKRWGKGSVSISSFQVRGRTAWEIWVGNPWEPQLLGSRIILGDIWYIYIYILFIYTYISIYVWVNRYPFLGGGKGGTCCMVEFQNPRENEQSNGFWRVNSAGKAWFPAWFTCIPSGAHCGFLFGYMAGVEITIQYGLKRNFSDETVALFLSKVVGEPRIWLLCCSRDLLGEPSMWYILQMWDLYWSGLHKCGIYPTIQAFALYDKSTQKLNADHRI